MFCDVVVVVVVWLISSVCCCCCCCCCCMQYSVLPVIFFFEPFLTLTFSLKLSLALARSLSLSLTLSLTTLPLPLSLAHFSLSLSLPHLLQAVTVGHDVFNFNFWRKGYWNKKGVKHAARDHSSRMWLMPVVTAQVWIFFILVSVYRGKEFFELMPSSVKSIEMKKKRGSEKGFFTWMWLVQVVTAAAWRFQFGSFHRERFFSRSCRLK